MLAALLVLLGAPTALAEEGGRLRVAHLSPDSPAVDVAVAPLPAGSTGPLTDPGPDLGTGLAYGTVGEFIELPPGSYAVSVRAAGATSGTAPVLSARVEVPAGAVRTVAISGRFADLALHTLSDDLSAPPAGAARVRVLAAAAEVGALDVAVRGGPSLGSQLPFGAAGEAHIVPAGRASLTVAGAGAPAEVSVDFAAGSVVTLLVLDDAQGGLTVRPVVDAVGPAVVPTGAVEAGWAGPPGPSTLLALTGAGTALALAGRRGRVLVATTALVATTGVAPGPATARPADRPVVIDTTSGRPATPVRIIVPSAGLDAALAGAGLDASGALVPPADPSVAGWYTDGPSPGETGPAVITGHVDWAGVPGVFAGLAELDRGAEIRVRRADGSTAGFTVTRVARHPKTDFPTAEVYAPTSGAELRLITCGGAFDPERGSYEDNVIVFARAVR